VKLYTIIITWRQLMDTTGLYLCRH
jgi:hypothetical protein